MIKAAARNLSWLYARSSYVICREIHNKKVIFSGIQPTGAPHLGNYFGAIKKWHSLQNEQNDCIFSIVDLHSITLPQDPVKLRQNIHLMTACLLACGIDPKTSILFLQSQVPQHAELSWILGTFSTMARLSHLPQYKEKSQNLDVIPLGLFIYPILQSADILLYKANAIPVGEDQLQHVQLCQHLARIFNNKYKTVFPVPSAIVDETCARIKSLRQPDKKMSKSDMDFKNRIELTDPPDLMLKRIKESLTDFTSAVTYDPENRPGVSNLILIHSLCTGKDFETICKENEHLDTGQYKLVVAEAVIEYFKPIQYEMNKLLSDPVYLTGVLNDGKEKAQEIASRTINEVKEAVGLSASCL
ncbi:tryptophan--tRNA ligase, mitochondrial-like [Uloborus diversus]|uniref:tryptophan--tRNA ligase, mitochondrial-like n=1 Tax=Uloborus diversus TaxID=327109 RepID=UPI00240A330D|nr:tryptophan--tRNA ligase, mitochondrial-like [Uloborus diversus]